MSTSWCRDERDNVIVALPVRYGTRRLPQVRCRRLGRRIAQTCLYGAYSALWGAVMGMLAFGIPWV